MSKSHTYSTAVCTEVLLIIGAQKAATTTLFEILKKIDGFSPAPKKELNFFNYDINYAKGVEWYVDLFKGAGVKLDASPDYIYSSSAAERIAKDFNKIKFVFILRDPVKRCFSAWNMFRSFHSNPVLAKSIYNNYLKYANTDVKYPLTSLLFSDNFPTFEQCVQDELYRIKIHDSDVEPSFVRRGFYSEQLDRYLLFFDRSNFLFLDQCYLKKEPRESVERVLKFVGVDADFPEHLVGINSNPGVYQSDSLQSHVSTLRSLYDVYSESNLRLFDIIGHKYHWNSSWLEDRLSVHTVFDGAFQCERPVDVNVQSCDLFSINTWYQCRIKSLETNLGSQVEKNFSLEESIEEQKKEIEVVTKDWFARGEHIERLNQMIGSLQSDLQNQTELTEAVAKDWLARGEHIELLAQTIGALQSDLQKLKESWCAKIMKIFSDEGNIRQ